MKMKSEVCESVTNYHLKALIIKLSDLLLEPFEYGKDEAYNYFKLRLHSILSI